jgi:hypothetical protein
MNLSTTILGSTAVRQLEASNKAYVLQVGSDKLTRAELAKVGCFNFVAARNVTAVLKELDVKSLADLFTRLPPYAVAVPHMGAISLAVLGAAFEAKKIGGETPLESWVRKHAGERTEVQAMVSFNTMKRRELAELAAEKKTKAQRKRARRQQAHTIRATRLIERSQQATQAG